MLQSMRASAKYIWWIVAAMFLITFVFYQQSGLSDRNVTGGSTVAKVNGTAITYDAYSRALRIRLQEEQQRSGRSLDADQDRQVADQLFNELVTTELLLQEYERRGITASDDEVRQAAMEQPYPPIARSPEFQTDGKFDFQKYQRFLASPGARTQGVLAMLESYYRDALLRRKLAQQVANSVFATDAQLWRLWRDTRDSAQVTYIALAADAIADSAVTVPESEIAAYFEGHRKQLTDVPGRAVLTMARLPRPITAADSAAAKAKAEALRAEIAKGAKFEDVARRSSADTGSASQGGALGTAARGSTVPAFDAAAFSLPIGIVSPPVLTPFGYHLIRVDARKGDSVTAHHILVRIQQSDSVASATDRRADALAKASGTNTPALFDSVVKRLGLETGRVTAIEGSVARWNGRSVPGASSWAFDGTKPGEVGELLDADDAYYLARLDSVTAGGKPTLAKVHDEIRTLLAREKKLDLLMPKAKQIAAAAAAAPSFEKGVVPLGYLPMSTPIFARTSTNISALGQGTEAIGAAFGQSIGTVGAPVRSRTAVVILRVDVRHLADSTAWEKQKPLQRDQVQQRIQQQVIQIFIENLRMNAKIVDNRKSIAAAARAPTT